MVSFDNPIDAAAQAGFGIYRQAPLRHGLQELLLIGESKSRNFPRGIAIDTQGPGRGDAGIQLAQAPGGGVAGIGKQRFTLGMSLEVQCLEFVPVHEHLATNLQQPGNIGQRPQGQGYSPDSAQVEGDVLASDAVAPGGTLNETPLLIDQLHRQAVQLGLGHILNGGIGPQCPAHPLIESLQLFLAHGVDQAEHGHPVADGSQLRLGHRSHALGGGVGRDELGVPGFQGLQLPHEGVVFGIGDGGAVVDVVTDVVLVDLPAQLFDTAMGRFSHNSASGRIPS